MMEILRPFGQTNSAFSLTGNIVMDENKIRIHFKWKDPRSEVLLVSRGQSQRADELWKTTCFEAFVQPLNSKHYWELNLSSSGNWNVYKFEDYRLPQLPKADLEAQLTRMLSADNEIDAEFRLPLGGGQHFRCGLSAVVELKNAEKVYFATHHAGAKPDFHLSESFILKREFL